MADFEILERDQSQFAAATGPVVAFIVPASKGPLGTALLCSTEQELIRNYGLELADDDGLAQARQAVAGGCPVRVSRVVHYTDVNDAGTKTSAAATVTLLDAGSAATGGTQSATDVSAACADGDTLIIDVNGTPATITLTGVAATITSGGAGAPWDLSGGMTLQVKIDRGPVQYVAVVDGDFANEAAVTAAELASVLSDGRLTGASVVAAGDDIVITSDTQGSASYVQITGGSMNTPLSFSTTEVASAGPNNVPNLRAVTLSDLYTVIVAAAVAGLTATYTAGTDTLVLTTTATGSAVYLGFNTDTGGTAAKFGWTVGAGGDDYGADTGSPASALTITSRDDGTWANGATVVVTANAADASKFDITITTSNPFIGATTYKGISVTGTGDAALPTADLNFTFTALSSTNPAPGSFVLASGNNGTSLLTQTTRLGVAVGGTGLYGFGTVDFIDLFIPNVTTRSVQETAVTWCEAAKVCYHVDHPSNLTPAQAVAYYAGTGAYSGTDRITSSYAAGRFGRLRYVDNLAGDGSTTALYGPAGGMASVIAFNDAKLGKNGNIPGPHLAPSGPDRGIVAQGRSRAPLAVNYDMGNAAYASEVTSFTNLGVNFFKTNGGQVMAAGNRTCQSGVSSSQLQYLNVRRGLIAIYRAIEPVLLEFKDEPLGPDLWKRAGDKLDVILAGFAAKGAFYAGPSDPGYRINCDQNARNIQSATINSQSDIDNGIFRIQIRVKPVGATDFVSVTVVVDSASISYNEAA